MASPLARGKAAFERARRRWSVLDHVVRMQEHYSRVNAGAQAGAVTYFAFLSFFPLLALAFFVVGSVADVYPDARSNLVSAINDVLPGMLAAQPNLLKSIQDAAATVGLIGALTLLYSGLGWLSSMRTALQVVFELPVTRRPNFVLGKLRDLAALVVVGVTLVLSVGLTGAVVGYSTQLLDLVDLDHDLTWAVQLVGVVLGLATNTLLFVVLFRLLASPDLPRRSLWQGALLGALGFEVLKQASSHLLQATQSSAAFQVFGIALILLVWINYFSRLVMYAAAWAQTSAAARARRSGPESAAPGAATGEVTSGPEPAVVVVPEPSAAPPATGGGRTAFGVGAGVGGLATLGLVAWLRRGHRKSHTTR